MTAAAKFYLGLAFFIVIAGAIALQAWSIHHLRGQVATLTAANIVAQSVNKDFAESSKRQNGEIQALKQAAGEREEAARVAIAKAEQKAAGALAKAAAIERETMAFPGDECKSLEKLLNDEIEGRNQ